MSKNYDASRASLYTPGSADDFFDYGGNQIANEGLLCAEMARLAYVKELDRLKNYLAKANFALVDAIGYEHQGTQVFIARRSDEHGNLIVVAFRGTESDDPTDLITDVKAQFVEWKNSGGKVIGSVHSGFSDALLDKLESGKEGTILSKISSILSNVEVLPTTILVTGHSLGAALATLMAGYLLGVTKEQLIIKLYTYGSPAVGNQEFSKSLTRVQHSRFVNCCDLVTRVPPEGIGYRHSGILKYINRDRTLITEPKEKYIKRDRFLASVDYILSLSFFRGSVGVRELADHTPINYVTAIFDNR